MNTQPDQNDVSTALSLLRDSLAEEEQRIRSEGAKAMQGGDYDTATSVIEFAKRLLKFQQKVEGLVSEWDELTNDTPLDSSRTWTWQIPERSLALNHGIANSRKCSILRAFGVRNFSPGRTLNATSERGA